MEKNLNKKKITKAIEEVKATLVSMENDGRNYASEYLSKQTLVICMNALDVIKSQQAEIERLKTDNALLKQDINADNAEIRALRRKLEISKSEAVKEFENIATDLCYKEFELEIAHTFVAIINKAKEMVAEEDK